MSAERRFLKKLRYASLLENDLRKELEELLTQPEPINFDLERMKLVVESPVSDITGEELMKQVKTNRVFYFQEGYAQAERDLKHKLLSEEDQEEEIILAYRKLIKKYIKNEMG